MPLLSNKVVLASSLLSLFKIFSLLFYKVIDTVSSSILNPATVISLKIISVSAFNASKTLKFSQALSAAILAFIA